ncbi:hypothetical protein STCU_10715 [Strigomonas culicis]|uniref:Uncharacterized protein n=1 Tax=Strigomonas culicis TaxID=28005 RepID=S9URP7_9TRYP|nr:hypothetical protein STCU_10715 [Strigomonas culicis]|eukprot:EPY17271.1 hypothetical protein STCU_10715 [Strigomonas culicis]
MKASSHAGIKQEGVTSEGTAEAASTPPVEPLHVTPNVSAENKPPPSVPAPPPPLVKQQAPANIRALTHYFHKEQTAPKLGQEKAVQDIDEDECVYVGCAHEVTEISDDD